MTPEKQIPKVIRKIAQELGSRGGKQTAKLYGTQQFQKMAGMAHTVKSNRYGERDFYALIRAGYGPSKMTAGEREEALAKIASDRAERLRRKKLRIKS